MKQGKKDGTDISSASFNFLNAKDKKERLNYLQEIGQDIIKSQIKDSQFPQIWKNLFDGLLAISKEKELMEIAEKISQLVTYFEFSDQKLLLKWVHDCFEVFHREWDHVDYALKSSVLYLMWFCFLQVLFFLQLRKFDSKLVKEWNQILVEVMLGTKLQKKATGMVLYTLEMFVLGLLELKNPSHDVLVSLLEPFVDFLAKSNDKALSTRIIENIFHIFLKDMKEGHFANFDTDKYAEHLRKRAGAKDVNESNKKLLEKVQKGFAEGIESDNEEEEGAVQKEGKKKGRKSKAELEAENQKGKKGKAQTKHDKKKAEKNKKNLEEEDDEDDEEDEGSDEEEDDNDGRMEDEDEDEEDENDFDDEEEEDPKPKKRNAGKGIQRKGTMGAKKGRKQEEEEEEGEEEDELPEDWEEEIDEDDLSEEGSEEELDDDLEEEAVNGLIAMSDNGRIPPYLLQSAKQQQIYFNKLNKEYYDNLKKAAKKAIAHKRKVNFQLKKNTVKEFNKKNKVDNKKNGNDRPSSLNKSILKKQSFGENLIKSAKGKKGAKKKVKI